MSHSPLVERYLSALATSDLTATLSLFAPGAVVHSPLYGQQLAVDFYPQLFADTQRSTLTLRATMEGERDGLPIVSFWFDFDWVLANGEQAPFSVVDVAELDDEGRVNALHIIYDTVPIRGLFAALR